MKKNFIALSSVIFAIALLPGCQKGDEYFINHGAAELRDCPIMQTINNYYGTIDTLVFAYNPWGDPVSATRLPYPSTGLPSFVFKYDKKRRLTDVIGLYRDGASAEVWHKYFYENPGNSNITKDSAYIFLHIKDGQPADYLQSSLTFFTYDKYDRIIKDSILYSWASQAYVNKYVYDANGNLTGRTYDNKVSILRTNKIWMFYDRDYSVNNHFVADNYNSKGLPAQINLFNVKDTYMRLLGQDFFDAQITYGCR